MVKRRARAREAHSPAASRMARRAFARASGEHGVTLVEILVSMAVMSFGLLALASVSTAGLLSLRDSTARQSATEAAAQALELARDTAWSQLANLTGDAMVTGATFDPDGPGCLAAENVIRSAVGPVTGAPYQVGPASPTLAERTVRTYVTDVAALDCPAAPATPTPPPAPAKRVTVVVQWRSGDAIHESRKSTMIAFSGRGSDTVLFDVTPRVASVTDVPGVLCLEHVLTNLGMADAYQIDAPTPPPGVLFAAYVDANNDGVGDPAEAIGLSTALVPFSGTLPLLFCYDVDNVNVQYQFLVGVRSFAASNQVITLTHNVQTIDTLTLYLHNAPNGASHDRVVEPFDDSLLDMDRLLPDPIVGPGAPPASAGVMFDYDRNIDLLGYQGMALPRVPVNPLPDPLPVSGDLNDDDSSYHGRWDYQMPRQMRVGGTGAVHVWTAPTAALGNPLSALGLPLPPPGVPFGMRYRLLHLDINRVQIRELASSPAELVLGVPGFSPVYFHATWGWQATSWDYSVAGPITVDKHDYLRLELVCDFLISTQSCHLGHDTLAFPARVEVPLL